MKKIVLSFLTVITLSACEKMESSTSENINASEMTSDSTLNTTVTAFDSIQKPALKNLDSAAAIPKDTAVVKIEMLNEKKKLLTEKVAKVMDSTTKSEIISQIKITQKKIDSVKGKIVISTKKEKATPRIIRETKVIYRDNPKREVQPITPKISKNGIVEIAVDDMDLANSTARAQINKYDGTVKSEQISSDRNQEINYLKVTVPFDKSDYLIADLEYNVGKITSKNIQITGEEYFKHSLCYLDITLIKESSKESAIAASPKNFGGRTLGAVGSGWTVIEEIFLFILPFWPILLIGGGIYYFLKKKRTEEAKQ